MVIMGVFVLIFWAISFFNSLKKRRAGRVFGLSGWVLNFFVSGLLGLFFGSTISFLLGNFVVQGKWVLVETKFLEPVKILSGEKYLIYKNLDFYSNAHYMYFTKDEQESPLIIKRDVSLGERDIEYNGEELRTKKTFEKVLKEKLYWFLFCSKSKTVVTLSSKNDIF